jgi:hypothetical protein
MDERKVNANDGYFKLSGNCLYLLEGNQLIIVNACKRL